MLKMITIVNKVYAKTSGIKQPTPLYQQFLKDGLWYVLKHCSRVDKIYGVALELIKTRWASVLLEVDAK
jgi:hypothetical protein